MPLSPPDPELHLAQELPGGLHWLTQAVTLPLAVLLVRPALPQLLLALASQPAPLLSRLQ
jgi:hypothetical protein